MPLRGPSTKFTRNRIKKIQEELEHLKNKGFKIEEIEEWQAGAEHLGEQLEVQELKETIRELARTTPRKELIENLEKAVKTNDFSIKIYESLLFGTKMPEGISGEQIDIIKGFMASRTKKGMIHFINKLKANQRLFRKALESVKKQG